MHTTHLPGPLRRRALRLGYINGTLWSIGNGLTTSTLIIYFAIDLGATGLTLSLLLALPAVVGLLRLFAPPLIHSLGGVKPVCLSMSLVSYVLLLGLPALVFFEGATALTLLVVLLCGHQLLEYLGTVALWAWLGELVPPRIRGRYFSRRQMWQLAALIPTLLASGLFSDAWRSHYQETNPDRLLLGYAVPHGVGAICLLASLVPLVMMPPVAVARRVAAGVDWSGLLAPLRERPFQRLVLFGCWLSFFNGIIQAPQGIYPKAVLGLGVLALHLMRSGMRFGQIGVSWWAGPFSDRFGNRPTMLLSQALVATAPLFFLLATPEQPWWIIGAWAAWSFYAALNVCLPNLMLRLSTSGDYSPYVAVYFATTGLSYAVSTVIGGWLFDVLARHEPFALGPFGLDRFEVMFWMSWITRSLAVVWLLWIIEPGALRWRDILTRRATAPVPQPAET